MQQAEWRTGGVECGADIDTDTDTDTFNSTADFTQFINDSCDARDSDTTYTSLSEFIDDVGYYFSEENISQFINDSADARDDVGGSGAITMWVDGGAFIYPNSTYASNIEVYGYIKAHDWTNASTFINDSCDARDSDTTYSALSEFADDVGYYYSEENISAIINASADARDSDTTYSALSEFVDDVGYYLSVGNITQFINDSCDARDSDTTYTSLSEFIDDVGYYYAESNLTTLLDDNYADISLTDTDTFNATADMTNAVNNTGINVVYGTHNITTNGTCVVINGLTSVVSIC